MVQPHQHLDPFRRLISERGICFEFKLFFESIREGHEIILSKPEEYELKYYDWTPQGETIESNSDFESFLKLKFHKALDEVKNNIVSFDIYNLKNDNQKEEYVELQIRYLQNLIDTEQKVFKRFPFIIEYLYEVVNELNLILPKTIATKDIDPSAIQFSTPLSTAEVINSIFSFFQGTNEQGEKIMSESDYAQLMVYVNELVNGKRKPTISQKLNPKLDNGLISFSFWGLHRELYGTRKIRKYFLEFLKEAFTNFDHVKIGSIKSSFGRKPKIAPNHLPPILKKYWNT